MKAILILVAAVVLSGETQAQTAREYLVTVTRPHDLQVVDLASNKLVRSCELPGRMGPGLLVLSPDGRIAYVLLDGWENVYGIEIETCEVAFTARQSHDDIRIKSFGSLAVSADGKELYTVQNPVRHRLDEFQALAPQLAVYHTADGLAATPVRTFPVDRRITTIAATDAGQVILGGANVKTIDPRTGETEMLVALQNWDRPGWLTPDAFAMFNLGEQSHEYILPYVTARFTDAQRSLDKAEWWWGMVRVDLASGKATRTEFSPFEFIIFNVVSDPTDKNILYGAFNTLSRHNVEERKLLKSVGLAHTYYNLNISSDGKRIYIGGTSSDIAVYDAPGMKKIGSIELPGAMGASDLRVARIVE